MNSYKLTDKVHNGYIFAIVTKRMYGLPQAGSIAQMYPLCTLSVSLYEFMNYSRIMDVWIMMYSSLSMQLSG